jgi:CRISPR-associated endonuclease/helicase Cas3
LLNGDFIKKGKEESLEDIALDKDKEWILYFLFVRILRICDQKATESFEKYYTL